MLARSEVTGRKVFFSEEKKQKTFFVRLCVTGSVPLWCLVWNDPAVSAFVGLALVVLHHGRHD